jgi:predicted peptidase
MALIPKNKPYETMAKRIGKTPVWIFHGSADPIILVTESREMNDALKALGGNVKYTEYPGLPHNSWDNAYGEPEFMPWLLSHRLEK